MRVAAAAAAALLLASSAAAQEGAPDCVRHPALSPAACCSARAPAAYNASFTVSLPGAKKANFTLVVHRSDAPVGADRLYNLVKCGFFSGNQEGPANYGGLFRVVPGFVVQWGIAGLPAISAAWNALPPLPNDGPNKLSNTRGVLAFAAEQDPATGQATNRTTQVYLNYADNSRLDALGFTPIGVVDEAGMAAAVDTVYSGYGQEPDQDLLTAQGDAYLRKDFPLLSYIVSTSVTP